MHEPCGLRSHATHALLLASLATLAVSPVAWAARGTDVVAGAAGYHWRDYADGAVIEPAGFDAGYTAISPADDVLSPPIALPFDFPFYGVPRSTLTISDNGWLGLSGPYAGAYPDPAATIPDSAQPNGWIAPFWDQLRANDAPFGLRIRYGLAASGEAFLIDVVEMQESSNAILLYRCYLYRSGLIRMQYNIGGAPLARATIGIENPAGTDGCRITARGVSAPGIPPTMPSQWVIEFEPPPMLLARCASFPSIDCGSTTDLSLPGPPGPSFVGSYGCRSGNDARERVVSFTLTEATTVSLQATQITARNLRMYLLASCNERDCLSGPASSVTINLGPGTYYVAVDASTRADEGTYTLALTCSPLASPITCGGTVSGTTVGGRALFPAYPCSAQPSLTGREALFEIDVPATTNLRARLTGLAANLDVLVLALGNDAITASDCVAWGDELATAFNVQGRYLIVVDGVTGATGSFTLEVDCGIESDCSSPAGVVDFGGGGLQPISGDTTSGSSIVNAYACAPGVTLDGPEILYELVLPQAGSVIALQTEGTPGLAFFVLDACNEGACATAGCGAQLAAGTHYLVVDGEAGAAGPFDASLIFEPTFNHWLACENAAGGMSVTQTVGSSWHFDDGAFCHQNPSSHNYPDGCSFAMYAIVQCGTAMHVPFYDVETSNLRILDVFRGEYVPLSAVSSGGWSMQGIDISWQDCTGGDLRWNNQTTDISFQDPAGLCGVFRLEFENHSGFDWQLFANCTGANSGGFNIHDSLCSAFSEFAGRPSLRLLSANVVANCPDVTITYTALNDGCGLARDVPVRLFDDGVEIATDILPEAPHHQTVTRTFSATFPGPTTAVTLVIDPDDVVLECDETAGVACDPIAGVESLPLPSCSADPCIVEAVASATPPATCSGGRVTIDARPSGASGCPSPQEYQLSDAGGIRAPWSSAPVFPDQTPTQSTDYLVEVRCAAMPACADSVPLRVEVERPPALDPRSVRAEDDPACNGGIRVTWGAATFFGPTGNGWYNLYRSTISCADAAASAPIAEGLTALAYTDASTSVGTTYHYVIEAEDATPATLCLLRGAVVAGASTRVEANGGLCQGVTDSTTPRPELLPRIEGTLRLGGSALPAGRRYGNAFVDLDWAPERPLDLAGGDHFHVLRSGDPTSVETLLMVEPPRLGTPTFRDADADDDVGNVGLHVWYYLACVSDACENDNRALDNP